MFGILKRTISSLNSNRRHEEAICLFSAQMLSSSSGSCGSCNLKADLLFAQKCVVLSTPEGFSKTGAALEEEAKDGRASAGLKKTCS